MDNLKKGKFDLVANKQEAPDSSNNNNEEINDNGHGGHEVLDLRKPRDIKQNNLCSWCGKKSICNSSALLGGNWTYCSERCYQQFRRDAFKKRSHCLWCSASSSLPLLLPPHSNLDETKFCSPSCLTQFKLRLFCEETTSHLHHINGGGDEMYPSLSLGSAKELITPAMWLPQNNSPELKLALTAPPPLSPHPQFRHLKIGPLTPNDKKIPLFNQSQQGGGARRESRTNSSSNANANGSISKRGRRDEGARGYANNNVSSSRGEKNKQGGEGNYGGPSTKKVKKSSSSSSSCSSEENGRKNMGLIPFPFPIIIPVPILTPPHLNNNSFGTGHHGDKVQKLLDKIMTLDDVFE